VTISVQNAVHLQARMLSAAFSTQWWSRE